MKDDKDTNEPRPLPPWLLGLIIAAALFVAGLIVFQALGFGDNPVLDPNAASDLLISLG